MRARADRGAGDRPLSPTPSTCAAVWWAHRPCQIRAGGGAGGKVARSSRINNNLNATRCAAAKADAHLVYAQSAPMMTISISWFAYPAATMVGTQQPLVVLPLYGAGAAGVAAAEVRCLAFDTSKLVRSA